MQTSRQTRQRYFCVIHLTASHLGLMLFSLTFAFVLALSFSTPITSTRITNQQAQDVRVLLPGSPVDGQLSRDEAHSYRLAITSGQFLRVVVAQRGITVSVKILDPNGQQLAEATNPTSRHSLALSVIATMSGDHRLEVVAAKVPGAAANGRHVISIEELKVAGPQEEKRIAVERNFIEGRQLQSRGEANSFREASKKYQDAVLVFREAGDRLLEATTLQLLGNVTHNLGNPRRAVLYYTEALSIWRALEDRSGQAQTLNSLGWSYFGLGELQKALENYNQALPLWRELSEPRGEAQAISAAGAARESLGDRQKALEHYLKALPLIRQSGDRALEAYTLNNMSWLYFRMDETQKALDHSHQALPIWEEVKNTAGKATALPQHCFRLQRFESAREGPRLLRTLAEALASFREPLR